MLRPRIPPPCRDVSPRRLRTRLTRDAILWRLYQSSVPFSRHDTANIQHRVGGCQVNRRIDFLLTFAPAQLLKEGIPSAEYTPCAHGIFFVSLRCLFGSIAGERLQQKFTVISVHSLFFALCTSNKQRKLLVNIFHYIYNNSGSSFFLGMLGG